VGEKRLFSRESAYHEQEPVCIARSGARSVLQRRNSERSATVRQRGRRQSELDRAVAALKANETAALSAFNDPSNKEFHDRDVNVFCFHISDGTITAYSSPGLLGIDIRTLSLKDDPIGKRTYDTVATAPEGSVVTMDYNFPKPGASGPTAKQSLEARVGDEGCAVGYFK
jgi:hypothetical protein